MAETEALAPMTQNLEAYGYAWRHGKGSATDQFRIDLRAAISKLNELGAEGADPDLPDRAAEALTDDWPEVAEDGAKLDDALRDAVTALLAQFPDGVTDCATNATAKAAFTGNAADLSKGRQDSTYSDWAWWARLNPCANRREDARRPKATMTWRRP